jgi:hypothetical protein
VLADKNAGSEMSTQLRVKERPKMSAAAQLEQTVGEAIDLSAERECELWEQAASYGPKSTTPRFVFGSVLWEIRRLYSERERNSGRQSADVQGHGKFEAECIRRGYKPRTVRCLVRDFEILIERMSVRPGLKAQEKTSAEQRSEARREKQKRLPTTESGITKMQICLAQFAIMLPLEVVERAYKVALELYDINPSGASKLESAWNKAKPYYEKIEAALGQQEASAAPEWTTPEFIEISTAVQ